MAGLLKPGVRFGPAFAQQRDRAIQLRFPLWRVAGFERINDESRETRVPAT